ncbi:MAG: 23S rRNA (uracil(1939)-C(5))-methyltransferase RlmD, partial [Flavobacteriales bacterium]
RSATGREPTSFAWFMAKEHRQTDSHLIYSLKTKERDYFSDGCYLSTMLGQLLKNVKIEGIDAHGQAFGRFSGGLIFIEKGVPGDVVDVQAIRLSKGEQSTFRGRIIRLIEPAATRIDPFCEHFEHCGGCQWQQVSYAEQLLIKQKQVRQLLERHLPPGSTLPPVVPSPLEKHYRNKIVFTFSNRRWMTPEEKSDPNTILRPAAGYVMRGKYDHALEIRRCDIAPLSAIELLHAFRDFSLETGISFYDMRKERGTLRQLMVRYADDGAVLLGIVFGEYRKDALDLLLDMVQRRFPQVRSVWRFDNPKKDGNISDLKPIHVWGEEVLPITLLGLRFDMHPGSFFQTNTLQTEQLYRTAIDFCGLTGRETVFDYYSGTGTIALSAARKAKKVVGLEFVPEAVEQAYRNAQVNAFPMRTFLQAT